MGLNAGEVPIAFKPSLLFVVLSYCQVPIRTVCRCSFVLGFRSQRLCSDVFFQVMPSYSEQINKIAEVLKSVQREGFCF